MKEVATHGITFEAASLGELTQSLRHAAVGHHWLTLTCSLTHSFIDSQNPQNVVFDSPAKTENEIDIALQNSVILNIDNWQEFGTIFSHRKRSSVLF